MSFLIKVLALLISLPALAHISNYVAPSSRTSEVVDRIEAYGCAVTGFRGFQPLSHYDLLEGLLPFADAQCQGPEWLLREREILGRSYLQSDARVFLLVQEEPALALKGQSAAIDPFFPLREGRRTLSGPTLYGELNLNSESGGKVVGFALSATAGWSLALEDYARFMGQGYLQDGYVKVGIRRTELVLGRVPQRFGDAKNGNLILSSVAKPLDMIKLAVRPHWIKPIDFFGPISFETWLAADSTHTGFSGAKYWAFQLGMRPWTFLEFGFLNLMHFGGKGSPDVGAGDAMGMFLLGNSPELQQVRHQVFATQLAAWGPDHLFKFYNQLLFGNLGSVGDWISNDMSWLLGVWFPKLAPWDFRVEVAKTRPSAYSHHAWSQGLTNDGSTLGHPLGGAGFGLYADLGLPYLGDWRPELGFARERRNRDGLLGGVEESRTTLSLSGVRRWERTEVLAQLKYQTTQNTQYTLGNDTTGVGAYAALRYSFL